MALDKLVDSTQLDSDLTSVANAIRTKGGTSAQLAFPAGFVSAIQNIPSGGGGTGYDVKTVNVSTDTPTVDRAFTNFIFIAQIDSADIPAAASRQRLYAYFMMFAYINGKMITPTPTPLALVVFTSTAGSATFSASGSTNVSNVGATSITFTTMGSQHMQSGTWRVLQVEIPSDYPLYSFQEI